MSPEQASGRAQEIGPASDIYSLGALLYHLLTRQPPFQAETITTLLRQVIETDPVPPRLLNPSIPRDLETICLKCLEKEPARRYSTSQALAEELARFLEDKPIHARPVGAVGKAWKWCWRRPAMAALVGALALSVVLGMGGVLWELQRATENARQRQASEYAADMHLAQLALADNNRALAVSLLDKYRPKGKSKIQNAKSKIDLRGWEWRYLWQLCRGDEPQTLHQYHRPINALAISRNGRTLGVATSGEVALWDLTSKQPLARLPLGASAAEPFAPTENPGHAVAPHYDTSAAIAFSPIENLLAVGTWDDQRRPAVELWELLAGGLVKKRAFQAGNHSLAYSPDGRRLAALGETGNLTIADCASGQIEQTRVQPLRYSPAGAVVFLADADHLAVGLEYGRLELRDLKAGTNGLLETQTGACITALAFSTASGLLAAGFGYGDGTIRLWDARSGQLHGQLTNHTDDITALAFTADGRQLVSASPDRTVRIWNVAERVQLRCFQSAREGLTALALLPDGRVRSGGSAGSVCLWETNSRRPLLIHTNLAISLGVESMREVPPEGWEGETLNPKTARRFGVAFTPDSQSFITLDSSGTLTRWDARLWRPIESLPALGSNHWGVALSPDGHWLATGDHPGSITFYDWTTRQAVTNFAVPFEWFGLLHFSRSGRYFVGQAGRNNGVVTIRIWRTAEWAEVPLTGRPFDGLFYPPELSPDDRLLAAGYANGAIKFFRFPSLQLRYPPLTNSQANVSGVAFSPDGRELVSGLMTA